MRSVTLCLLAAAILAQACSKKDDSSPPLPSYTGGPLCSTLVTEGAPNELFISPLLLTSAISYAYPFGGTEPSDLQEVINFELGFYIVNDPLYESVPMTAPADLYVSTLEVSRYDDDQDASVDRIDYGVTYEVCSQIMEGVQSVGVGGNFAHLHSLAPDLLALLEAEEQKLADGVVAPEESPLKCANGLDAAGTCTLFVSLLQEADPEFKLVLAGGAAFATTRFPGTDANLKDYRRTNFFLNPERWTSSSGHTAGWKYGACTYEYFVEPYRTEYLRKVGANGVYRNVDGNSDPVVVDHPCGLLEADLYGEGTAAGFWMNAATADLGVYEDMPASELEAVLSGLMVLTEHFLTPNTHIALSTHQTALSGPNRMLVELPIDTPPGTFTNVPFKDVVPGTVYCYEGTGYMNVATPFSFLLELTNEPEQMLAIERLADDAPCSALAQVDRVFTAAKINFVR